MSTPLSDVFVQGRIDPSKFGSDIKSGFASPQVTRAVETAGKVSGGKFATAFERAKAAIKGKPLDVAVKKPVIPVPDLPAIPPLVAPEVPKPDTSKFESGLAGLGDVEIPMPDTGKFKAGIAGLAAGLGAVFGATFAQAVANEASNDKLAAQLGASPAESKRLGKLAGSLYSNAYGDSLETVNASIRGVVNNIDGMRKASGPHLKAIAASVLDISTAFDEEGDAVTRAAGQLVRTGMAKNARQALDIITVGFQSGADKSQDFLDTLNEYGTQFRKLGLDGKAATGLLSQGLQAGARDSDIVADALKEFSIRATDGSDASQVAFEKMGLSAEKMTAQIARGGPAAEKGLSTVLNKLRGMKDPVERSAAAVGLFGTQAEDMGDALYALDPSKAVDAIGKVDGAAKKMGDTLNDNASANIATFWRSLKTGATNVVGGTVIPRVSEMAATFNEKYVPAIKDAIEVTADVVGWFREHKRTTVALATAIGIAVAVTQVHGAVMSVQAAGGLASYIKGTKLVTGVTKTWTAMQWLLNAALSANPIGLVIAALVALGIGLAIAWKKSETFRRITTAVWETVKEKTQVAALWVADKVLWMAEKMLGAMSKAFSWVPGLGDKMQHAYQAIKGFREAVNREMDQIQDENVNVTFAVGRRKSQEGTNSGFGPQISGGAGPLPSRFLAAAGGAGGLTFKTKTDMAGVRGVASAARGQANAIADELREQARAEARRRAAAANASGPSGKAGRVLPAGAYSIGMPYHGYAGHNGADYPAPTGTPVSSPWAGRVVTSADLPGSNPYNSTPFRSYGRYIKIQHSNGLSTLYAHLSARGVSAGQAVKAGQFIGRVGMNGNATGPHLHFETSRNGSTFNPASLGIFDRGGIMRGLGINLSGQPERVLSPRQTALHDRQTAALEAIAARGGGSNRVRLVVRDREFDAYIEDVADGRVRTHKRHRDQLDRMGR